MTYYDQIAQGYEELHKEEQLKKVKIIAKYLNPNKNDKLLDVGCGTGITTEKWNCIKYGLDPAIQLIKKGKTLRKDINFIQAEAEDIPFEENYFDFVISITAIQNFHNIKKGLQEIKRVGKGKFILSFLKKSKKKEYITKLIKTIFKVKETREEEKDIIFII